LDVEANETTRDRNNDLTLSKVEQVFEGYCEKLRERWGTKLSEGRTIKVATKVEEQEDEVKQESTRKEGKEKKKVRFELVEDAEDEGEAE